MAIYHRSSLSLRLLFTIEIIISSTPLFASPSPQRRPNATTFLLHIPLPLQPNPTNSPVPTPSSSPLPPLPLPISPPAPSTAQEQLNNIIDTLIGAGDFNTWSNILSDAGSSTLPLSATHFIPADDSLLPYPLLTPITIDPFIFPYHSVPQRLSFSDLRLLPPFSCLPTLLPAKTTLITNTSITNFTLDDTLFSHPDLYTTPAIAVHGIVTLLDYKKYGNTNGLATSISKPSPEMVRPPAPRDNIQGMFLPQGMFMPDCEVDGARKSDAACLCMEFPVVFRVVCGVLALKIHRYLLAR